MFSAQTRVVESSRLVSKQADRDPLQLQNPSPKRDQLYRDLVARYAKHWAKNPAFSAKRFALAAQSLQATDIMSYIASDGKFLFKELIHQVDLENYDLEWLLELAETIHSHPLLQDHLRFAAQILRHYTKSAAVDSSEPWLENYARLLLDMGKTRQVETLFAKFPELAECTRGYLLANLYNPFTTKWPGDEAKWDEVWRNFFAVDGNPAPELSGNAEHAFDRLTAPAGLTPITDGPLVTVVMTAYNPDPVGFRTSINSILQQTWQNLELLIVDDASAPEFAADIAAAADLDPRIRVVHLTENGGTYRARNAGWTQAQGEYITGQDADDWAHPQRIAKQVQVMIDDPEIAASTSQSVRLYNDLTFVTHRVRVLVHNESSLMIRKAELSNYGPYLPIRKGADSEIRMRINSITGRENHLVEEVLSLVRSSAGSLSTADFSGGWAHPARGAFSQSMNWWNKVATPAQLRYQENNVLPFPILDHMVTKTPEHLTYDLVLTSNWTRIGADPGIALDLAPELHQYLPNLGMYQLQSARLRTATYANGHPGMLALLQAGTARQVISSDQHRVRALVISDPTMLNFENHSRISLNVESLYVIATEQIITEDSPEFQLGYHPELIEQSLDQMVGLRPVWIPVNDKVRTALQQRHRALTVSVANLEMPMAQRQIRLPRTYFRSNLPVIGRFAGADRAKWPAELSDFAAAYPDSPDIEIRTCGRIARELRGAVVGQKNNNWLTFDYKEIPVSAFLNSLDFYVNFDQEAGLDDSLHEIRLALAAGLVVILPEHYREYFGDAALYCKPQRVQDLVLDLYGDPQRYFEQSAQAIEHVLQKYSPQAAATRLLAIIGHKSAGKP